MLMKEHRFLQEDDMRKMHMRNKRKDDRRKMNILAKEYKDKNLVAEVKRREQKMVDYRYKNRMSSIQ